MDKETVIKEIKKNKAVRMVLRCYKEIADDIAVIKERGPAARNSAEILLRCISATIILPHVW